MTERRKRRFMAELVGQLLKGGRGPSEVATELGLSPGQLSGWRNEHLAAGSAEALAARKAEQAELRRLNRPLTNSLLGIKHTMPSRPWRVSSPRYWGKPSGKGFPDYP